MRNAAGGARLCSSVNPSRGAPDFFRSGEKGAMLQGNGKEKRQKGATDRKGSKPQHTYKINTELKPPDGGSRSLACSLRERRTRR